MRRLAGTLLVAAFLAAGLLACGSSSGESQSDPSTSKSRGSIAAPMTVKDAGSIVYCSDISYPPMEFYEGTTPTGVDIEVGDEIARRLGVSAEYENTGFNAIIAAAEAGKCDAINSSLGITPERAKRVEYAPYALFGLSMMVKKGDPAAIETVDDLSGRRVAVQIGSTTKEFAEEQSRRFEEEGKPPVEVLGFNQDTDAASALVAGKVDAYIADTPPAAWYVQQNADDFELAGKPMKGVPVGLAAPKGDTEMIAALRSAVAAMYADGTMKRILQKWELTELLLPPDQLQG